MGLPVYEGYGLSECASVVCLNTPAACRIGSVGRPLPHARVRIDAQGELHVRGAVMVGYLGSSPVRIAEVATGDVGEIDADGFVYIRGRRKDVLITSLGRNVSPEWVESQLLRHEAISQAMVVGESRPYLGALIVSVAPDDEIGRCIDAANSLLPDYARVRSWTRVQSFSAQLGFTTPNGRLRRAAIASSQASVIDALFSRAACIS